MENEMEIEVIWGFIRMVTNIIVGFEVWAHGPGDMSRQCLHEAVAKQLATWRCKGSEAAGLEVVAGT